MRERAIRARSGKAEEESVLDGTGDDDNVAVESVGADESGKYVSTGDDVPISTPPIRQLGWDIDPHQTYDIRHAGTSEVTGFDIVVDRNGQQPVVFLNGMRC